MPGQKNSIDFRRGIYVRFAASIVFSAMALLVSTVIAPEEYDMTIGKYIQRENTGEIFVGSLFAAAFVMAWSPRKN